MKGLQFSVLFILVVLFGLQLISPGYSAGLQVGKQIDRVAAISTPEKPNFCQGCRSLVSFFGRFNYSSQRESYRRILLDHFRSLNPVNKGNLSASKANESIDLPAFYVDGFYFLLDRIDPVNHCDQIGACNNSPTTVSRVSESRPSIGNGMTPYAEDQVCTTCEHLVNYVKRYLLETDTIRELKDQVAQFCHMLSIIGQEEQCNDLSEKYLEQTLEFIQNIKPIDYCRAIRLCKPVRVFPSKKISVSFITQNQWPVFVDYDRFGFESNSETRRNSLLASTVIEKKPHPTPNCVLCKTIINELFRIIHSNKTEANIVVALDKVCTLVFPNNREKLDECDQLVDTYTHELIQLLTDETDPTMLCILLEQCTYSIPEEKLTGKYKTQVMSGNMFGAPSTRFYKAAKISPLPNKAQNQTEGKITFGQFITMLDSSKKENSVEACLECRMFIQFLQKEVDRPNSRDQIKNFLLTKLCDSFQDQKTRDSCIQMVDTYADIFFRAIVDELDPKKACAELGVCKLQLEQKQPMNPFSELMSNLGLINIGPAQVPSMTINIDAMIPSIPSPSLRPSPATTATIYLDPQQSLVCDECQNVVNQIDEHLSRHSIGRDVGNLISQACPRSASPRICRSLLEKNGHEIVGDLTSLSKDARQICVSYYDC